MSDDPRCLVSVAWLATHLQDDNIVVLDASWHMPAAQRSGRAEFEQAHIPGARFFDIDEVSDQQTDLPHMLPDADGFGAAVGALGISNTTQVVVYDTHGLFSAARVWWMFTAMGHSNVAVLDGGLPAWTAAGHATTSDNANIELVPFKAKLDVAAVTDLEGMQALSRAGTTPILDARPAARFDGTAPEPRPGLPSGHMPGATSLPFTQVVTADGHLKSADELRRLFEDLGVNLDAPIVTSCGSGVTAAILSLALARCGAVQTSLYDGSWTQWATQASTQGANSPDCPIEITQQH